ncbi:GlsB/YeaQ/YmgE family stress response membrane protein [Echinicola strongylocentroti]|uniref:GlsB/YeaQ/YmgE family stress response membrane protein n=1 Tax=Echinicola strongylocentroti TaxID=1795355 RepID=A0A2Z4IDG8_9BACT|nr:GlsB/YeaQ/YmgE family stress response membrane protein [Echinicola strongylocentroti]AWW28909.1 GlsB/YeaQ/YmgE family stress response membrane protein [Echinicola strongylocentroti]
MTFIWWIIFGLIAGALAKWIMPGKDPGGFIVTTLIGIGGAFVGGFVGRALGFESAGGSGLGWGLIWAILGALLILYIWKKLIAPNFSK